MHGSAWPQASRYIIATASPSPWHSLFWNPCAHPSVYDGWALFSHRPEEQLSKQIVIATIVLALIAIIALLLRRRAFEGSATFPASTTGENGSQSTTDASQSISKTGTHRGSDAGKRPAVIANPLGTFANTIRPAGARKNSVQVINLADIPSLRKFLPGSSPQTRTLFERGLALMRDGDYREARIAFQALARGHAGDPFEAPAYFLCGITYHQEGDLAFAAEGFRNVQLFFGDDQAAQDFVFAAEFDLAVTEVELMRTATTEQARLAAAHSALIALNTFLQNWPNSPQATAAAYLIEVQQYLSGHN